jgi:hypothetical protein
MRVVLETIREIGLEGSTEETKYIVMSHHRNAGQNLNLLIANKSFKNMVVFR